MSSEPLEPQNFRTPPREHITHSNLRIYGKDTGQDVTQNTYTALMRQLPKVRHTSSLLPTQPSGRQVENVDSKALGQNVLIHVWRVVHMCRTQIQPGHGS